MTSDFSFLIYTFSALNFPFTLATLLLLCATNVISVWSLNIWVFSYYLLVINVWFNFIVVWEHIELWPRMVVDFDDYSMWAWEKCIFYYCWKKYFLKCQWSPNDCQITCTCQLLGKLSQENYKFVASMETVSKWKKSGKAPPGSTP